jgi:hypothetical protein
LSGTEVRLIWGRERSMIEVQYELEGGIDTETAARKVERVLGYYQQVLLGLTCPVHGKAPWLQVRGRTVNDLAVTAESCCPVLAEKVDARIRDVSRRDQI